MSIALAPMGRLWPTGGTRVIREQFVDIIVNIEDPQEITMEMREVTEIAISIAEDDVLTTVEVIDTATGVVIDPVDISGNTEGCS